MVNRTITIDKDTKILSFITNATKSYPHHSDNTPTPNHQISPISLYSYTLLPDQTTKTALAQITQFKAQQAPQINPSLPIAFPIISHPVNGNHP